MDNFEFYSPTRFVFGRGAEEKTGAKKEDIPALVAKLGLNGNTVGTFKPLAEADVTRILESCCA